MLFDSLLFIVHEKCYIYSKPEYSVDKVIDPEWRKVFPVVIHSEGRIGWRICGKFARYSELRNDSLKPKYKTHFCVYKNVQ